MYLFSEGDFMEEYNIKNTDNIEIRIECLRRRLHYLIKHKNNLLDPEIILLSQQLDKVLNNFHEKIGLL